MPGIEIGEGCVIGANSVVTKSVPDYEIWADVLQKNRRKRIVCEAVSLKNKLVLGA